MKTRIDFVTNSSSSSFIALKKGDYQEGEKTFKEDIAKYLSSNDWNGLKLIDEACKEFGWSPILYNAPADKLNFVLLQVACAKDDLSFYGDEDKEEVEQSIENYKNMVESVLEEAGIEKIDWDDINREIIEGDAYIDHQSKITDNSLIKELLFSSEENLRRFLFNTESCVITGNDNCEPEDAHGRLEKPYFKNPEFDT